MAVKKRVGRGVGAPTTKGLLIVASGIADGIVEGLSVSGVVDGIIEGLSDSAIADSIDEGLSVSGTSDGVVVVLFDSMGLSTGAVGELPLPFCIVNCVVEQVGGIS